MKVQLMEILDRFVFLNLLSKITCPLSGGHVIFSCLDFYWIGPKSQLFGLVIKMSKLVFATIAF